MINFEYSRASNVADAVSQMAASPGAKFIAGGTNLVDLMKMNVERPVAADRRHTGCRSTRSRRPPTAACASARWCPIPISPITRWSSGVIRCCRARSWPAPRSSCATWPRRAATCVQRTRCAYFYDIATPCNKREPGTRLLGDRRHQPHERDPGHQRRLHRDASVGHVRGAGGAGGASVRVIGPRGERAIAVPRTSIALPGDTPQRDTNLEPDETHARRSSCRRADLPRTIRISRSVTGSLCLRAGVRRGRPRARGRHDQGGAISRSAASRTSLGATSRPKRSSAARPPDETTFAASRRHRAARCQGLRPQRLQDRAGAARPWSARSRRRRAAPRSRSPARKSRGARPWQHPTSEPPHPASTALRRSPARRNMPPNSTFPASPTAASSPRPSPRAALRASTPARRTRVEGVLDRADAREPSAHGGQG